MQVGLNIASHGRDVVRLAAIGCVVVLLGLVVGGGCVVLPPSVPFAIVGLFGVILVWIMPELNLAPARVASFLLYPFAFSLIAIPTYFALVLPGLPWISLRRILLFSSISVTLIAVGSSSFYRQKLMRRFKATYWFSLSLGIFLVIQILASLQSVQLVTSVSSVVNSVINYYIPLMTVVLFVDTYEELEKLVITLLNASFVAAVFGGVEYYVKHPFLYKILPPWVAAQIAADNPMAPMGLAAPPIDGYRAFSVFMVPLSWAEMAMMLAPLALHLCLAGKHAGLKVLGAFTMVSIVASLFFAGSRGGYVGFIAGILFYLTVILARLIVKNPTSMIGPLFGFVYSLGAVGVVGSVMFVSRVHKAILGSGVRLNSDNGRHDQWVLAIPKFFSRPILGYGPGTSNDVVGYLTPGGSPTLDSYIINVLIGTGILGIATYLLTFAMPLISAFKLRQPMLSNVFSMKAALAASIFGHLVYRLNLNQVENFTLLYLEFGMLIVLDSQSRVDGFGRVKPRGSAVTSQVSPAV